MKGQDLMERPARFLLVGWAWRPRVFDGDSRPGGLHRRSLAHPGVVQAGRQLLEGEPFRRAGVARL